MRRQGTLFTTLVCALMLGAPAGSAAPAAAAVPQAKLTRDGRAIAPALGPSGLRWDTSYSEDGDRSGPGWSEQMRPTGGFRMRHPLGLFSGTPLA